MGGTRKNTDTQGTPFYFTATKMDDGRGGEEKRNRGEKGRNGSYNKVKLVSLSKIVAGRVVNLLLYK